MREKVRLSATVDAGLVAEARRAVANGRAPTVSAWVNEALRRQADHERRLAALDEVIRVYEADHGVITEEEMDEAVRWAKATAVAIRPRKKRPAAS